VGSDIINDVSDTDEVFCFGLIIDGREDKDKLKMAEMAGSCFRLTRYHMIWAVADLKRKV